jgi:hypothetical protein
MGFLTVLNEGMPDATSRVGRALATASALLVLVACQSPIGLGNGRVSGLVGAAPAQPLGNVAAPAAGKTVQLVPTGGGESEATTTGTDGRYSIDLSPGNYEVRLNGYNPLQLYYGRNPNSYGQWPSVKVTAGRETKLDLIYDSGIR